MSQPIALSEAKARLSELVRNVRRTGEPVVVTVDGEPAATLGPVEQAPRELTAAELATERALLDAIARLAWTPEPFDAVELVQDGRR